MTTQHKPSRPASGALRGFSRRLGPFMAGFVATMVSLPGAQAVTFPADPLQSGTPFPPANIMFILDDSGSMQFEFLPEAVTTMTPIDLGYLASELNPMAYDPSLKYVAWNQALTNNTFARLTGGTSYSAAFSDIDFATDGTNSGGSIDLGSTSSTCQVWDRDYSQTIPPSTKNSCTTGSPDALAPGTRTFLVLNSPSAPIANSSSYDLYQIRPGGTAIVKGVWGTAATFSNAPATFPKTSLASPGGSSGTFTHAYSFTLPALAAGRFYSSIVLSTSGGSDGGNGADLYVRRGSAPTTGTYDCRSQNGNNSESCTIDAPAPPQAGDTIYVSLRNGNSGSGQSFSGVTLTVTMNSSNRCPGMDGSSTWVNCVSGLPPTAPAVARTLPEELVNYATWYSYHRSRMKAAKAGASEAFSKLGSSLRVGYDSIWNRAPGDTDTSVGTTPTYPIPVSSDGGLFRDTTTPSVSNNRSNWWKRLFAAENNDGTPLRSALKRSGDYYINETVSGPWGPSLQSCRQSFSLLTTDGYWNGDSGFSAVGNADSTTTNTGTAAISSNNATINGPGSATFIYIPANPFRDNPPSSPSSENVTRSNTLADVAMYYWKNDLAQTLTNNVPASAVDNAFWQHMVTFGVSLGAKGPTGHDPEINLPDITAGTLHWRNPLDDGGGGPDNIDDLWHASVNGHGSFVAATSPAAFAKALSDALALIGARRGSASNVATNSTSIQANTRVFQARYLSQRWTGELAAHIVTSAGVTAEPDWQASQLIPVSRTIRTWNGGTPPTAGIVFPKASQVTALDQSSRPNSSVSGANNAAYIAGNASLELRNDGTLRDREISIRVNAQPVLAPTVLGDIVNSTPAYVKELETVFVGANDGMLHAFDAITGVEKFAYVPGGINLANLSSLSDPEYGKIAIPHQYFVDGQIAVSSTAQTPGFNYLVGALGRGGQGVFGLNVTTPSAFTNAHVLWEYGTGDNDMGNVLGEPVVVTLNDPANTKAVLVPNGYNSVNGHAVLYIINIATGAVIKKLDTGATTLGLSAPRAWDNDGNGTVDYVYAGDLNGNLWKFDLRDDTASYLSNWVVSLSGAPLMVARDASNNRQPITAGLALAREPIIGKRWVFIGTGKFLETGDLSTTTVQSMYGLIDDDAGAVTARTSGGDGDLERRTFLVTGSVRIDTDGDGDTNQVPAGTDGTFRPVRGFEPNDTLTGGKKGWYIDLVLPPTPTLEGERIISSPRINGTVLLTASLIPPVLNSCDASGRGYINALDAFSGTSTAEPFFNANGTKTGTVANFTDDTLTSGGTTVPIGSVDLGLGMPTLPTMIDTLLIAGGSAGTIGSVTVNPQGPGARRVSWREILRD